MLSAIPISRITALSFGITCPAAVVTHSIQTIARIRFFIYTNLLRTHGTEPQH